MLWIGFILVVAGLRLAFVANYGSALPILDQWDAEAATLYKPWLEDRLRLADLIAPHNEHRILTTRIIWLALLSVNGQWDARVQMTVNVFLATAAALVLAVGLSRFLHHRYRSVVLLAVGMWSVLPYAWENTTWGFQTPFYLLVLLSLLAIWGLGFHQPNRMQWAAGLIAGVVASMTLASGFIAAAIVAALYILRLATGRVTLRSTVPTLLVCTAIIGASLVAREHVVAHDHLKAASLAVWLQVFAKCLAWPFATPALALVLYLPLGAAFYLYLRQQPSSSQAAAADRALEPLLALGGWAIVQAAAIAYARGNWEINGISSRYMDLLALGTVANLMAAVQLPRVLRGRGRMHVNAARVGCLAWVALVTTGALLLGIRGFDQMRGRAATVAAAERNVRIFVRAGARMHLEDAPDSSIPYVNGDRLAMLLSDPTIRAILPAVVRPPLRIQWEAGATGLFQLQPNSADLPGAARVWTSGAAPSANLGQMRSEPLRVSTPYLYFRIAGSLRRRMSIHLREEATGKTVRLRPSRAARTASWRDAYVRAPGAEVRIIARDENTDHSFAFEEPTEVGFLSHVNERLLQSSSLVVVLGISLFAVLGAFRLVFTDLHRIRH